MLKKSRTSLRKSNSPAVSDTEVTPEQIKKNVAFETVKGVCSSIGAMAIGIAATTLQCRRLNAKNLPKPNLPDLPEERFERRLGVFKEILGNSAYISLLLSPISALVGYIEHKNAVWHNDKVDGFTQRLEQKCCSGCLAFCSIPLKRN